MFSSSALDDIANGKIRYSQTCGWINWEHSKPLGPKLLIESIRKKENQSEGKFIIEYSQKMTYSIGGNNLIAETSATYKLPINITQSQEDEIGLLILIEVSEKFEEMQGEFPFNLIEEVQSSSFRKGDLTGNLLSYYLALHSLNRNEIIEMLDLLPIQSTPSVWLKEKSQKENNWNINIENCFLNELFKKTKTSTQKPELVKIENRFYLK
jgi:hypothetical protein